MCNVCGCGAGETRIEGQALDKLDEHAQGHKWVPAAARPLGLELVGLVRLIHGRHPFIPAPSPP